MLLTGRNNQQKTPNNQTKEAERRNVAKPKENQRKPKNQTNETFAVMKNQPKRMTQEEHKKQRILSIFG